MTEYFDKLCSAINPFAEHFATYYHPSQKTFSNVKPTDYESDLTNLINSFQWHSKCGNHCLRLVNETLKCCYNFPHKTLV